METADVAGEPFQDVDSLQTTYPGINKVWTRKVGSGGAITPSVQYRAWYWMCTMVLDMHHDQFSVSQR